MRVMNSDSIIIAIIFTIFLITMATLMINYIDKSMNLINELRKENAKYIKENHQLRYEIKYMSEMKDMIHD